MRGISKQRELIERQGRRHAVKRGRMGRLHFENMPWLHKALDLSLRVSFIRARGRWNALNVKIESVNIAFGNLPNGFDNTRILFITDFHIDATDTLADRIIRLADDIDYDFCILGGDYSFGTGKNCDSAFEKMSRIARHLTTKSRVFAVLGNHDRYKMAQVLNECGVEMLINEGIYLEKAGDKIYIAGLDDCHYYAAEDIALTDISCNGQFKIMVSHSPERFSEIASVGYSLLLTGHTHGGQVCLPGGVAVVTSTSAPRKMAKGIWQHQGMTGYTSRGVGTTSVAVRYFCPPEMAVITLTNGRQII